MPSYLIQRIGGAMVVVFGVVSIVFLLIHLIPGDPVDVMLGEGATAADRESLRRSLGLDRPVAVQFLQYLGALLRLDFGTSLHSRRPVTEVLLERLPATAQLAFVSLLVAVVLTTGLAVAPAAAQDEVEGWPREMDVEGGTLVIYQPQPEALDGNSLSGRAAVLAGIADAPPAAMEGYAEAMGG